MLLLDNSHFVAQGKRCSVYSHPEYTNLLVKVANFDPQKRNSFKNKLLGRFSSISHYRLTKYYIRELIESIRLRRHKEYTPPSCLQQVIGLVDTNFGLGLVVFAERGRDGHYAKTLKSYIQANQFDSLMQKKLMEFYESLLACDIAVSDCGLRNLVYAYNSVDGDHFVLIDGIGEKNLIPFLRMSAFLRQLSRQKHFKSLKKSVDESLMKYGAKIG